MTDTRAWTATADAVEATHPSPIKSSRVPLFTASVLALFIELILIRWIPSVVHVVGFFANVVLIASFLGLGAGMMSKRENAGETAVLRLAILVALLTLYRIMDPTVGLSADTAYSINEVVFAAALRVPLPVILIGVFSLTTWALIPFGSLIAGLFDQHERIPAYTVNITGSLAGVLAFTAVSG